MDVSRGKRLPGVDGFQLLSLNSINALGAMIVFFCA